MKTAVISECVSHRARRAALVASFVAAGLAPRAARANPAAAEALFQQGRRLLKEGKLDEACPKLAESQRLDPSSGTLLNLADCHERQGKTATAWAEFLAASRAAYARGNESRGDEAKRRAARLEPSLAHLAVMVAPGPAGLTVKRNGEVLEPAQFGTRLPTDPGEYVISAEAEGRAPFRTTAVVKPGDNVTIVVPQLAPPTPDAPPRPAQAAPTAPRRETPAAAPTASGSRPALGYVAGGLGVAALGAGAAFGLMAQASHDDAKDACPSFKGCTADALDARERADVQAWVANVGVGVGVLGLAVGAYFLFIAPSKPAASASAGGRPLGPRLAPAPGGGTGLALHF